MPAEVQLEHPEVMPSLKLRPSFLDQIEFSHEPREDLGRYLLFAERELSQRGLHTTLITPGELLEINKHYLASWAPLMPVLDHRYHTIAPEDMITIASIDGNGGVVATITVRRLDVTTNVTEELDSLRMFYGHQAELKRKTDRFVLTANSGRKLKGSMFYLGGLWVHPEWRHASLPWTLLRIVRYAALASWDPDYEIGIATNAFLRPEVARIYAFKNMEDGFEFYVGGKLMWRGVFVWSDRAGNRANLADDLQGITNSHPETAEEERSQSSPSRQYGNNSR